MPSFLHHLLVEQIEYAQFHYKSFLPGSNAQGTILVSTKDVEDYNMLARALKDESLFKILISRLVQRKYIDPNILHTNSISPIWSNLPQHQLLNKSLMETYWGMNGENHLN